MKKVLLMKIGAIVIVLFLLVILFFKGISVKVEQELHLKNVCVAIKDILPRTKVDEDDIMEISIPEQFAFDNIYYEKIEIVGKYTEIQGMIPAGSFFYKSMLKNENELPDYPYLCLKEGQAAFTLETDLAKLGGAVVPGQRVNLFLTINLRDGNTITGTIVEQARVISVKDHKGIEIQPDDKNSVPHLVILALQNEDIPIVAAANEIGSLRLITSADTYDVKKEAVLLKDSSIVSYVMQMMMNDDQIE